MLYDILRNRGSVNLLKKLYDAEVVQNKGTAHTSKSLNERINERDIKLLKEHKLILTEHTKNHKKNQLFLSITRRGKEFINVFDQLIVLLNDNPQKSIRIEYNLSAEEKKLLVLLYKIEKESGAPIETELLTQEYYSYESTSKKERYVSKIVESLEEIRLVVYDGKKVSLTPSGMRVAKEQITEIYQ